MSEEKRAVTVTFRLTQEEKNNLEYTLSRRQNEFITLNESYSTLKAR